MARTHTFSLALALLLVLSVVSPAIGTASAAENVVLRDNYGLNDDSELQDWEDNGYAFSRVSAPMVDVALAEDQDQLSVDVAKSDLANDYLMVKHREQLPATYEIHVRSEYFSPYNAEDVESLTSSHTADFSVSEDGNYTVVRVHFDEQGRAVFPISKGMGVSFSLKRWQEEKKDSWFGGLLGAGDDDESWTRINASAFDNQTSVELPVEDIENTTVQYDAGTEDAEWLVVPDDPDKPAPFYLLERTNETGVTSLHIVSEGEAYPVRYKEGAERSDAISAALREIPKILESILDALPW